MGEKVSVGRTDPHPTPADPPKTLDNLVCFAEGQCQVIPQIQALAPRVGGEGEGWVKYRGSYLQVQSTSDFPFEDAMDHLIGTQNACETKHNSRTLVVLAGSGGRSKGGK